MTQRRLDFSTMRTDAARRDNRGLRVPGNLTRTGVFVYRQGNREVRELRHPDEVFHADSLASLEGVPVIEGHPAMITDENRDALAKGLVLDGTVRRDGKFVAANMRIIKSDTIKGVEDKRLVEVSCGYDCDIDPTPGVYEGERYDQVQTNIRYNHVGLGPQGWGRAGSEVRLRLDGETDGPLVTELALEETPVATPPSPAEVQAKAFPDMTPEQIAALIAERDALKALADKANARADALQETLTKERASLPGLVSESVALREDARKVLGSDVKLPATDAEVISAVVAKAYPDFKADGKSSDYLRGRFDQAVTDSAKSAQDRTQEIVAGANPEARADGTEVSAAAARADMQKRHQEAFKVK